MQPISSETRADPSEIEHWMNEWMSASRAPIGALHVSRFKDPMYFLLKPISWNPNPGQEKFKPVTVPKGFVTDFASIPRIFWSLLKPDGDYTYPAIIHDFLYWNQGTSRDEADSILKFGMEDFKINFATVETIYGAVRLAGGFSWDGNASRKENGEKRILKKFPQDPTLTWDEWRKRPDVFAD